MRRKIGKYKIPEAEACLVSPGASRRAGAGKKWGQRAPGEDAAVGPWEVFGFYSVWDQDLLEGFDHERGVIRLKF